MAQLQIPAPQVTETVPAQAVVPAPVPVVRHEYVMAPPPALVTAPVQVVRHEYVMVAPQPPPSEGWFLKNGGMTASAALIAAVVALIGIYVARTNLIRQMDDQRKIAQRVSRASVVSANRQKWIDALREDLAELITADAVVIKEIRADGEEPSLAHKAPTREELAEAHAKIELMHRRIQLRLNPEKPEQIALMNAVEHLINNSGKKNAIAQTELIIKAQAFLRGQWLRLKKEAGDWDDAIEGLPEKSKKP